MKSRNVFQFSLFSIFLLTALIAICVDITYSQKEVVPTHALQEAGHMTLGESGMFRSPSLSHWLDSNGMAGKLIALRDSRGFFLSSYREEVPGSKNKLEFAPAPEMTMENIRICDMAYIIMLAEYGLDYFPRDATVQERDTMISSMIDRIRNDQCTEK